MVRVTRKPLKADLKTMTFNELLELNLDDKNRSLWNEIKENCNVKLEPSFEPNYITNFKDGEVTIFIDIDKIESHSFAHELLHVKLRNDGMIAASYLNDKIHQSENLNYIFSKGLEDHIGNCLEHVKMFPLFVNLGYRQIDFLSDFKKEKLTQNDINYIKSSLAQNNIIDKNTLDYYIGKFFAAKACLSENSYYKQLTLLKSISPNLYDILKEFWADWSDFSIEEEPKAYEEIIDIFVEELEDWAETKIII